MTSEELGELVATLIADVMQPVKIAAMYAETSTKEMGARITTLEDTLGLVRERLAAAEARAPIAGPPGRDGRDGTNGADGADGLGFDDLEGTFDGERTLALTFTRGSVVKTVPIVFRIPLYRGIYTAGMTYQPGDLVTWGGSTWHCALPTATKPGEGASGWRLMVKCGRDGRDVKTGT